MIAPPGLNLHKKLFNSNLFYIKILYYFVVEKQASSNHNNPMIQGRQNNIR